MAALAGIFAMHNPNTEAIHRLLHGSAIHFMPHARRLCMVIHGHTTANDVETLLTALVAV